MLVSSNRIIGRIIETLYVLKNRTIARDKLLNDLLEKSESIDIENYDLIDFNINKCPSIYD